MALEADIDREWVVVGATDSEGVAAIVEDGVGVGGCVGVEVGTSDRVWEVFIVWV